MDPQSRRAREMLERYRDAESLSPSRVGALLAGVERRVAGGGSEPPFEGKRLPKPGRGSLQKALLGAGPKVLLFGCLVGAGLWAWRHDSGTPPTAERHADSRLPADSARPLPQVEEPAAIAQTRAPVPAQPRSDSKISSEPTPSIRPAPASDGARPPGKVVTRLAAPKAGVGTNVPVSAPAPSVVSVASPAGSGNSATGAGGATTLVTPTVADDPSSPPHVDDEVRSLARAYALLRRGQPTEALALLDRAATTFPEGKLVEAREVARMVALCDAGRDEAVTTARARFLAAHPSSPFADRVRGACSGPSASGRGP